MGYPLCAWIAYYRRFLSCIGVATGTLLAIYGLMAKDDTKEAPGIMDDAIKSTGIIMLITGAGGSLGNVIKVSGIGDALGETVMALPLPAILIPFIIAALMRIALGSATVAITTAASLSASEKYCQVYS